MLTDPTIMLWNDRCCLPACTTAARGSHFCRGKLRAPGSVRGAHASTLWSCAFHDVSPWDHLHVPVRNARLGPASISADSASTSTRPAWADPDACTAQGAAAGRHPPGPAAADPAPRGKLPRSAQAGPPRRRRRPIGLTAPCAATRGSPCTSHSTQTYSGGRLRPMLSSMLTFRDLRCGETCVLCFRASRLNSNFVASLRRRSEAAVHSPESSTVVAQPAHLQQRGQVPLNLCESLNACTSNLGADSQPGSHCHICRSPRAKSKWAGIQ